MKKLAEQPTSKGYTRLIDPSAEEVHQLLEELYNCCGIDFRNYAYSSIKRRIVRQMSDQKCLNIQDLSKRVLGNLPARSRFLKGLTVHVTSMFRDPEFYVAFQQEIMPILKTYSYTRFWIAGCSTGEEVYSLAILLHESGLYNRCRIYATDVSEAVVDRAKAAIFPLSEMQEYTRSYQQAGGNSLFSEYYTSDHNSVIFRPFLKENLVFGVHNLVSDASFNEFHVIFCRNVMIYFNRSLQERVHRLFYDSLITFGYLGLGRSESIRFSSLAKHYKTISVKNRLYCKKGDSN